MKRTPLRRGTKQLKRTPLLRKTPMRRTPNPIEQAADEDPEVRAERVAKIKARFGKSPGLKRTRMKKSKGDPPEIRARRADYVAENPACQYALAFEGIIEIGDCRGKKCCEHIFGRGNDARERPANYATTCWWHHEFKTTNGFIGRVLILAYKWRLAERTGDRAHFDCAVLAEAIGRPVENWLHYAIEDGKLPEDVAAVARMLILQIQESNGQ